MDQVDQRAAQEQPVEVLEPQVGECVLCYAARAVAEHGCDHTLRWAGRFARVRVPEASSLLPRLRGVGACDCEVLGGHALVRELLERDVHTDELAAPAVAPPCAGVRRTSARACRNWERVRRR